MEYSVVTTVYNDQNEILQFLNEMCKQNKIPKEIVIADGGGSDSTRRQIKEYAKSSTVPIRLYEGKRLNIAEGFNKSIREAKADIVGIAAVGNHYPPHFFSMLCEVLEKQQQLDAVFSIIKGDKTTKFSKVYNEACVKEQKHTYPSNHGTLIRKKCVEDLGYFYEKFYFAGEDEEFYVHFLENGKQALCIDETWVTWVTPKNWQEYFRQCKLYLIGQMQMYSNTILLKRNWKYGIYALGIVIALILFLFAGTRILGLGILFVYFTVNFFFICKKGLDLCAFYNITYLYKFIMLITCRKYMLEKNKIDKSRRLKNDVKYG